MFPAKSLLGLPGSIRSAPVIAAGAERFDSPHAFEAHQSEKCMIANSLRLRHATNHRFSARKSCRQPAEVAQTAGLTACSS
jgi:hypothetical protein